jgi:hypothetical protein
MINLDLGGNGDLHSITDDIVNDAIQSLDNNSQKVNLLNIEHVYTYRF